MAGLSNSLARQLGLTKNSGRQVVRSIDELIGVPNGHALRRAWERIGLSAILFVDGRPTTFFKELQQLRSFDIRRYQRFVWNQGIATLLVVTTPTEVFVFSGQAPPANEEADVASENRLVEKLDRVNDALEVERLVYRIETGRIYEQHPESFDQEQAVDQYLLRNLGEVANQLHQANRKLSLARIHSLLGRAIFVCYLVDREIIGADFFADAGAKKSSSLAEMFNRMSSEDAIDSLYKLFAALQAKFNGSLFDEDLSDEKDKFSSKHIEILTRFLNGDEFKSGQKSLGFWAYDFNFIPIETISAIYEEFLGVEQQAGQVASKTFQRKSGAYYTPKHLAELVIDTATDGANGILGKKSLDPACGSGIFLVSLFNRMAEEWRAKNPNRKSNTRWRELVSILQNDLFGIDKNETACRITCFSLYLALLDQFAPFDITELSKDGKLLPALMLKAGEQPTESSPRTILCRNFFEADLPPEFADFDLIIGNPPWIGRNQPGDPIADAWYKKEVKQTLPSRQIAHAFMWKCPQHLDCNGRVSLVLPSKVFLNRTDDFQIKWFDHHHVEEVLQLADLRFVLFENAICPSVVVRFGIADATEQEYAINYISPQANRSDPRRGVVVITPNDSQYVRSTAIKSFAEQKMAPSLWKRQLRGTPRDIRLLDRLMSYPQLSGEVGEARSNKRWKSSQGFQPDSKGKTLQSNSRYKPQYPWWPEEHLFINAKKQISFFLSESECEPIGKPCEQYYFVKDERIFKGPMVLISQGFTKIAFCEFDVLFQDSLQSIAGLEEDRDLLVFLSAFLRSRLANYFLFHTSANWGTERDKVQKYELLQLPFVLPDHEFAVANASKIVKKVCAIFDKAVAKLDSEGLVDHGKIIRQADKAIEPLIFEYFDCDEYEQALIHDTCEIVEPSATPTSLDIDIPTLRLPSPAQRENYGNTISNVLNSWGQRSPISISARTIASPATGLGIVVLSQNAKRDNGAVATDEIADDKVIEQLNRLRDQMRRENGMRTYMRGVTLFDGKTAYIIKPLSLRFWTKTAALNDADSIAAAILNSKRIASS
jgi:hypothetical protein